MYVFMHNIFTMLILYFARATVATICTLSMILAIVCMWEIFIYASVLHLACVIVFPDENLTCHSVSSTMYSASTEQYFK